MAGPALKQLHAHRAIHDGGLSGAIQKTESFLSLWWEKKLEGAEAALDDVIDYWKTRIISHADAEESGFYEEVVTNDPSLERAVIQLERDHELLRIIVKDIEMERKNEGINDQIIQKLFTLIHMNEIHSRDEERLLFPHEH